MADCGPVDTDNQHAAANLDDKTGDGTSADHWTSRLRDTLWPPFWILSPTWGLANVLKPRGDKAGRAARIRQLNHIYFWSSLAIVVGAVAITGDDATAIRPDGIRWWAILIQYLILSRFFEIGGAFLRDAFDKIEEPEPTSSLGWGERVVLAMRSYVELILDFALVYALLPASAWVQTETPPPPSRITDMVWYSANVVTTSGGGGYYPASLPLKLLTVGEVLCGVILLVVSFTIYTSRALGGACSTKVRTGWRGMNANREDVIAFLRRRSALIVHFASAPQLVGTGLRHPDALLGVIADRSLELSCSVVQPGDGFGMAANPRNATGMVGLILSPRSDSSVIAVDPSDAGSVIQKGGRRHFKPRPFDIVALEKSMDDRGRTVGPEAAYNECGMRDYGIIGLFVANRTDNEVVYAGAVAHDYEPVATTVAHFGPPPLRVLTFDAGGIVEIVGGGVSPVRHAALHA